MDDRRSLAGTRVLAIAPTPFFSDYGCHVRIIEEICALRPHGVLAINLCDLTWGTERKDWGTRGWVGDDWALVTEVSLPSPDRFVRQMATFTRNDDGSWRRDDERHDNVLIDSARVPELLAEHGVDARLGDAFGAEEPIVGLRTVIGRRRPS